MKTIYIDSDFKCHTINDGTMTAVETNFFDGKCNAFIEGYRFVPAGETWIREDGEQFSGEMIVPLVDYRILENAQSEAVTLSQAGAAQVKAYCTETGKAPNEGSGIFVNGVLEWEAGKTYERFELFSYNGAMGYVKQTHTAQEVWLPFTPGTEALYGARPAPDHDGVYPYVYNMAAVFGMMVRDPNGNVYACTMDISDMLYPPSAIPAHFMEVAE